MKKYAYTGQDNLEVMSGADNYNAYQRDFLLSALGSIDTVNPVILDFGAGIGTYADMLRSSRRGLTIECVEPTESQAKILRKKGYKVYKNIRDVKKQYDVVYSLNVLEHIEDDEAALKSQVSVLKPRGIVVAYVPAFMLLYGNLDRLVEHWRRYTFDDLKRIANQADVHVESLRYCDPLGFFAALLYRVIGGSGHLKQSNVWLFDKIIFPLSSAIEPLTRGLFGKNALAIYRKNGE